MLCLWLTNRYPRPRAHASEAALDALDSAAGSPRLTQATASSGDADRRARACRGLRWPAAQGQALEDEAVAVQGGGLLSPSSPRSRGSCRVVTSRQERSNRTRGGWEAVRILDGAKREEVRTESEFARSRFVVNQPPLYSPLRISARWTCASARLSRVRTVSIGIPVRSAISAGVRSSKNRWRTMSR